jgi:Flp pilus assembly protein TadG
MRKSRLVLQQLAKRLLANEDGVVAIEFGLVASFLILMLIGATDLGLAMSHRSQMEGAVRAGMQEALKGATEAAVEDAVRNSTDLPSSPAPTVSATKKCYDDAAEEVDCDAPAVASIYMEITVQQDHNWLLGFPGFSNPATLTITNSVRVG